MANQSLSTLPEVREAIHFDTLWATAQDMLSTQSGQVWTDTAEHDPGVTLLQALSYGVSDLSYRHTLPLRDLLTPKEQEQSDGLFPADFGPHRALTCAPVTEDDYRRALLDLTADPARPDSPLLFRNARLLRENPEESYAYYYNQSSREFLLKAPTLFKTDGIQAQRLTVQGGYQLQLELNRDITKEMADPILLDFLKNNINLCERMRKIDWLAVQDVHVTLELELDDDFQDYPALLAQVYNCVESYLSPQAQRNRAAAYLEQGLDAEAIYQGPMLTHGWITQLPSACDYLVERMLNINPLAIPLQALKGVKSLRLLAFDNNKWEIPLKCLHFPRLCGEDPLAVLVEGKNVKLMKRGQQVLLKKTDITLDSAGFITEAPVTLPYGRHRNPARYHPVSDKVPPCYGLQTPLNDAPTQLHQFLLPFEQQLANGCDQLAMLPALLSFKREAGTPSSVRGSQWPFAADSVAESVHAGYKSTVNDNNDKQGQNEEQDLALLNHLLGYFGQQRADRTLLNSPDYLASQRAYLSQNSELNYQAAQFRADAISALQRRIAARLGFDGNLFVDETGMSKLPFYLVEHASLLPKRGSSESDQFQPVTAVVTNDSKSHLTLTLSEVSGLYAGNLLELQYKSTFSILACVVTSVNADEKTITLQINAQMRSHLDELLEPGAKVAWRFSNLWMNDISFNLQYVEGTLRSPMLAQDPISGLQILTVDNFPSDLRVNDTLILYRHLGPENSSPALSVPSQDIAARVVKVDALRRQVLIAPAPNASLPSPVFQRSYRWCVQRSKEMEDRFSFTVSVVFDDQLLLGADSTVIDPYVTAAWIRQIVQQELPGHIRAELHWLSDSYFKSFAYNYASWVRDGAGLGNFAFIILEHLALGILPSGLRGINAMYIATDTQRDQVLEAEDNWDETVIEQNSLLYVPPALS